MDDKVIHFENIDKLINGLHEVFNDLEATELRDLLFFLDNFRKEHPIPEGVSVYVATVPIGGLEIIAGAKISEVLIAGVKKFLSLGKSERSLPPIVVVKGGLRRIILYGELNAVEAYIRNKPIRGIVFDLEDADPLEFFKLDPRGAAYLVPFIEESMEKEKMSLPK